MTRQHGFELLVERHITELNTHARLFRHVQTGAELLSLENEDENKVFSINFRTPPPDSTGLPHIMEHSVLCGSRKYPVREPFVELMKGSLATFVNAFTFPDKTCYPVASQNVQDFYNLIDVYMDAVLYPLITPHTLAQEGWHYELNNPGEPLTYKGVVFNEMKGAYSAPDDLLYKHTQETLFPGHAYGLDSGGDPAVIPNLTYAQFKAFHDTYYHPSNARIFFYGDDDPEERLRRMDAYLKEFSAAQIASEIPLMPPFEQPRRLEFPYAVEAGEENPKAFLVVNWVLPETRNCKSALAFTILEQLLIGTPASPLRKALIDAGLGEDLAGVGMEMNLRQAIFSTGLKGILPSDADKVEALMLSTLRTLAGEGISPDTVAASLNTMEFRLRENNTGRFPRGLSLMLRALQSWLYGRDPIERLSFEIPLEEIKTSLAQGETYFENLIRAALLENPHRVTILLKPDPSLAQRQEADEKARLEAAQAAMSQADLKAVLENMAALKHHQETPDTPEALATLPSLRVADLERLNKAIPLEIFSPHGSRIFYHDLFTNGILYLDVGLDLHTLPQEYLPYVNLFGRALLEMGTEKEDYVSLLQRIGRNTGGIKPVASSAAIVGERSGSSWLFLRGKAMPAQAADLLGILRDVLLTARLDNPERFRQIMLEEKANLEMQLSPMGHLYTGLRLQANLGESDWADEQMSGVSYLFFLRRLSEQAEQDWPAVLAALEHMRRILLNRRTLLCNVTLDAANWAHFQPRLEEFIAGLPEAPAAVCTVETGSAALARRADHAQPGELCG